MPVGKCLGCGKQTNSTMSNWWFPKDSNGKEKKVGIATECYGRIINGKMVKGCSSKVYPFMAKYVLGLLND